VAPTFNLSTWEAEAGGFLSSKPAWSTKEKKGEEKIREEKRREEKRREEKRREEKRREEKRREEKRREEEKKTHRNIIRTCFHFNPRYRIRGCFRVSTAADCNLPHALSGAWFYQLQIVSMTVTFGILRTFERIYKC